MPAYSLEDQLFATLMAYREAANQGDAGIAAVLCVARNNALKHGVSLFAEITKPFRYSSINCPVSVAKYLSEGKEVQLQQIIKALGNFPDQSNTAEWAVWQKISNIVVGILSGVTEDITNGATLYYSTDMLSACPWDASKVVFTTQIGSHRFYRELT